MMKAVVFRGPRDIVIEQRPIPVVQSDHDVVIKVKAAGLCGSELHMYRGNQKTAAGHIMGHEFSGVITEVGKGVKNFKVGDFVISPFTTSCMNCWFCDEGLTARCENCLVFGTQQLDGGQAEYVRVPYADGTLFLAPEIDSSILMLMSDIFPTGYYAATNYTKKVSEDALKKAVVVSLGCGPVGLCAVATLVSKGVGTIYAVDTVPDRLEQAEKIGAIPINLDTQDLKAIVLEKTSGRGADAVLEVVGNEAALLTAFELLRPFGYLSSVGFHQGNFPFSVFDAYHKNITMQYGRCPVRSLFKEAMACLESQADKMQHLISHRLPLDSAPEAYDMFEKHKARKVVFNL